MGPGGAHLLNPEGIRTLNPRGANAGHVPSAGTLETRQVQRGWSPAIPGGTTTKAPLISDSSCEDSPSDPGGVMNRGPAPPVDQVDVPVISRVHLRESCPWRLAA
jgi:hypothetical protein